MFEYRRKMSLFKWQYKYICRPEFIHEVEDIKKLSNSYITQYISYLLQKKKLTTYTITISIK